MVKLILRIVEILVLALVLLYAGDYLSARYRIPGNRQTLGSVQVQTLWAVKQKNGNVDYSLGDAETQTCVRSLFPEMGYPPCWYLNRHTTKVITVSDGKWWDRPDRPSFFVACHLPPFHLATSHEMEKAADDSLVFQHCL